MEGPPPPIDWNDVSLPSHCWTNGWQPSKTIVTNGWLSEKPLKNHWHQWLSWYHFINGNGDPKNHWFLAMVLNFLLYFLAKAKIKPDFKNMLITCFRIANLKALKVCQLCELAVKYFGVMLCLTFYSFLIYLQFVVNLSLSRNTRFFFSDHC